MLARLEREQRSATAVERETLAAWSSWGAVPEIFDETRAEWTGERERLHELLGEHGSQRRVARRSTRTTRTRRSRGRCGSLVRYE